MRLWSVDSEDEDVPAPVGIEPILEYTAEGGPDPRVTIPEQGDLSSRVKDIQVREPGGEWTPL